MCKDVTTKDLRGLKLEKLMTTVFRSLQEAEELTEGKIDLEFILTIVGSYVVANDKGELDDDVKTPAELFEERIFPLVDNSTTTEETIEAEVVEKDDGE
jgi:chaperonin cofactor prefoldin